jgi:hypothetical protein
MERIAARQPEDGARVVRSPGHSGDRSERERLQLDAMRLGGGELAEQSVERMIGADLIRAPRHDDQGGNPVDAPAEVSQKVEGGLVGPVDVLEDDRVERASASDRGGKRGEHPMAGRGRREQRLEVLFQIGRHVEQRPERSRCPQRFAGAPEESVRFCLVRRWFSPSLVRLSSRHRVLNTITGQRATQPRARSWYAWSAT